MPAFMSSKARTEFASPPCRRREPRVRKRASRQCPGCPPKLPTSYLLARRTVSSKRPAGFLASSVLLPASSAQASASVALPAASASLPVEGFAVASAVGLVSSPDGSAVALRADDSLQPAASASLPAEGFAAAPAVGLVSSPDGSAVALRADDSLQPAEGFAAAQAVRSVSSQDGSAVALPADDSLQRGASAWALPGAGFAAVPAVRSVSSPDGSAVVAEQAVPVGRHLARCRGGQWSALRVCQEAPPLPSGAQPRRRPVASSGSHARPKVVRDALRGPAAVLQTAPALEAASASRLPAGSLLLAVARSHGSRSKLSLPARFAGWEPRRPSCLWELWQSPVGLRQLPCGRRAARRQRHFAEPPSPHPEHSCSRKSRW